MILYEQKGGTRSRWPAKGYPGSSLLFMKMNNDDLKYAIENGIIDLSHIQENIEMSKRRDILEQYEASIWEASDGYWKIRIYDDETKKRKLIKRRNREDLEDEIVRIYRQKIENPKISEIFNEWIERRSGLGKISQSTKLRYQQLFNRHFDKFGSKKIRDIDQEDFRIFVEEQVSRYDLTAKGFSNLKTISRGMLKWAKRKKFIDWNVEEFFDDLDISDRDFKKKIKEDSEEVFNDIELQKMVEYLKEDLNMVNLGILLMFVTGIRLGELSTLKWEDWIYNRDSKIPSILKIRRTETRYKVDGEYVFEVKNFPKSEAGVRNIVIPRDCVWILQKLKCMSPFSEYIFFRNGHRIKGYIFRERLYRACEKTGCVRKSPHKIRKTYCSILLDHSIDNQMVISQMGHSDIKCSENFYHRDRKTLARKQEIMDNIQEFSIISETKRIM